MLQAHINCQCYYPSSTLSSSKSRVKQLLGNNLFPKVDVHGGARNLSYCTTNYQ